MTEEAKCSGIPTTANTVTAPSSRTIGTIQGVRLALKMLRVCIDELQDRRLALENCDEAIRLIDLCLTDDLAMSAPADPSQGPFIVRSSLGGRHWIVESADPAVECWATFGGAANEQRARAYAHLIRAKSETDHG